MESRNENPGAPGAAQTTEDLVQHPAKILASTENFSANEEQAESRMHRTRLLYKILSRPTDSIIVDNRKRNELGRAIKRTAKPVKAKYTDSSIAHVKEWR